MKTHRKDAGVYTFTNGEGFSGEILKQPDGLWSVFDPATYENLEYFHSKKDAVDYAEGIVPAAKIEEQNGMSEITLINADPWAWLDK